MFTFFEIILILLIHFIADFVLQTDYQAKNKSISIRALLSHTLNYSKDSFIIYGLMGVFVIPEIIRDGSLIYFILVTFIAHTITDFITSKITRHYHKLGNTHNFFVVVGFDQVLHYFQLFLTYHYFILSN